MPRVALVFGTNHKLPPLVLAGLDPAIHGPRQAPCQLPWMPGARPGMDDNGVTPGALSLGAPENGGLTRVGRVD